jgi:RNA polymerase sigma-70 factor (ECF subfamily)
MEMTLSKRQSKIRQHEKDPALLEALFQEHWERICRLLYRLTGDWDDAEDLALETFMQFHRNPPEDDRNLAGWLYRVAWRLGLNALRSKKRRQEYEQKAGLQMLNEAQNTHNRLAEDQAHQNIQVRKTMLAIKPRSAQLLLLRYSGFSYTEIASIMELAPTSVGALLTRAEKEFEKLYEE